MLALAERNVARAGLESRIRVARVDAKATPWAPGHLRRGYVEQHRPSHSPSRRRCSRRCGAWCARGASLRARPGAPRRGPARGWLWSRPTRPFPWPLPAVRAMHQRQRELFEASLRAALTVDEVRAMVGPSGHPGRGRPDHERPPLDPGVREAVSASGQARPFPWHAARADDLRARCARFAQVRRWAAAHADLPRVTVGPRRAARRRRRGAPPARAAWTVPRGIPGGAAVLVARRRTQPSSSARCWSRRIWPLVATARRPCDEAKAAARAGRRRVGFRRSGRRAGRDRRRRAAARASRPRLARSRGRARRPPWKADLARLGRICSR